MPMILPIGDSSIVSSLNWVSCQSSSTGSYNALLWFHPQLWSMEVKPNHFVPQEACAKAIYCPRTYLSCAKIGNIFCVKMNVSGPAITYVMFADDLMLFAKGKWGSLMIVWILIFSILVRRLIEKNLVLSSLKRSTMTQNVWMKGEMQIRKLELDSFYPGTPVFSSNSKTKDFKYLIDRLDSKLKGWQCKTLS